MTVDFCVRCAVNLRYSAGNIAAQVCYRKFTEKFFTVWAGVGAGTGGRAVGQVAPVSRVGLRDLAETTWDRAATL